MKCTKWVVLALLFTLTACVYLPPPVYDVARTQEGMSIGGSITTHYHYNSWGGDDWDGFYVGPDIALKYGFNRWLSWVGQFGWPLIGEVAPNGICPSASTGIKLSTQTTPLNLALRLEAAFPTVIEPTFPNQFTAISLAGLSTRKGHEYLTAGVKVDYWCTTIFLNMQPFEGVHLQGGMTQGRLKTWNEDDFFISVGYTHSCKKEQ